MEHNENTGLKEKIAKDVSNSISGLPPFPCVLLGLGEPKMPVELIMEDCED